MTKNIPSLFKIFFLTLALSGAAYADEANPDLVQPNEPCGIEAIKAARALYEINNPKALSLRLNIAVRIDGENGEQGEAIHYWDVKFNSAQDSIYKVKAERRANQEACTIRSIERSNAAG